MSPKSPLGDPTRIIKMQNMICIIDIYEFYDQMELWTPTTRWVLLEFPCELFLSSWVGILLVGVNISSYLTTVILIETDMRSFIPIDTHIDLEHNTWRWTRQIPDSWASLPIPFPYTSVPYYIKSPGNNLSFLRR